MSSETDQPRQRTVAELLAQHGGDSGTTGRRRRRREPDDDVAADGAPPPAAGAPPAPTAPPPHWPQAHSPMPDRPSAQPPASLAGPPRSDPPRPPSAMPQKYPTPGPNGSSAGRGGPSGPPTTQWGPPARREPDRSDGFVGEQVDPRRDRMPTGGWGAQPPQDRAQPQPDRAQPPQDRAQPDRAQQDRAQSPQDRARPDQGWGRRPGDAAPEPTGQRNGGQPRPEQRPESGPPPRAFAPGPEPARGAPPHAQNPHAGAAGLAASAQFGGPPTQIGGRSGFDQPGDGHPAPFGRSGPGGPADPGLTGPIDQQRMPGMGGSEATSRVQQDPRRAADHGPAGPVADPGPATAVGIPPAGAEDWHRARVAPGRIEDSGPATAVTMAPAVVDDRHRGRVAPDRPQSDRPQPGRPEVDPGPPTEAAAPMDFDEFDDSHPAGLGPVGAPARAAGEDVEDDPAADGEPEDEGAGSSWAPVLAQWIVGAIGGAALWVGFRFLWSSLLVVAIAAAVLVTAGLVVAVRTVLHNTDLRTSIAAGLVGVLLTASPAVLVLLGR
jgi:hypothetical protein